MILNQKNYKYENKLKTMIAFIIIPVAVVSFIVGRYHERFQWNKLIKMGKLPRPKNSKLNHQDYWANRFNP